MAFCHSAGFQPPSLARVKSVATGVLVGTYGLRFGSPSQLDIQGDYFDWATDFGTTLGNPIPVMVHHGQPLAGITQFATETFGPATLTKDVKGLWAEFTLDTSDALQAALLELVEAGALRYSTGSAVHMVKKASDGRILTWPIVEISLTATPAEFRLPRIKVL